MFAILYETSSSGFYLGLDNKLESAKKRFEEISDDLLKHIKQNKFKDFDKFFEMYGVFHIGKFCNEFDCYKITTHNNQIIKYELLFKMKEFCLYVVETEEKFNSRNIRRLQNYFYSGDSQFIDGAIEIILN